MEFEKVRDIIVETLGCDAEEVTPEASLADDLGAVRARAFHNSTAVAAQKQRGAEDQRRHGHAGDQRCRQDYGAGRALHGRASPAARARRSATGDVPLYFLKQ